MDKFLFIRLFFFLLSFVFSKTVFCQDIKPDTLFTANAVIKAKEIYTTAIATESHLFNGVQYKELKLPGDSKGHPYFLSDDWLEGSIHYDGQQYQNISMLYDLIRDKIVIDHNYSHFDLELIVEKVKSFSIENHIFMRLVKDSLNGTVIHTGFYEMLYDGKVKLYAKRRKDMREVIEGRVVHMEFDNHDQFFVLKNGHYYSVRGRSSIINVFKDKKSSLRKHLRKNNVKFRANRDFALAESVRFYDEPEKQP